MPAGNGALQAGHGEKVKKNDKVFSFLRKRKNFKIFSTCSDGGDIEAGDGLGASRLVGRATRPRPRRADQIPPSLRTAARPEHVAPMLCSPMRLPAPPLSNVQSAIHRELGASRLVGRAARPRPRRADQIPPSLR